MQRVETSQSYPQPPEVVWDVYTDHANWSRWSGMGKSWLEVEGVPDRNGAGAVRGFGSRPLRVFEEVLDFEPPKRMTYRLLGNGPLRNHLGEVRFEPDGTGTRVLWGCQFDSAIPGMGWLLRWFITRTFQRALAGLGRGGFPESSG